MSFTIKCNKCGNEQEFHHKDIRSKENIEVEAIQSGYMNGSVDDITIYCEHWKCNNEIQLRNN